LLPGVLVTAAAYEAGPRRSSAPAGSPASGPVRSGSCTTIASWRTAAQTRPSSSDGGNRPEEVRQVTRDGIENLLITCLGQHVGGHAIRGPGHAPGDELSVELAAAFRPAVGHLPRAVVVPGRPARIRVAPLAGGEQPGRSLVHC
jgi:hypothetical protein